MPVPMPQFAEHARPPMAGMTLVEAIVVIVIAGILMAVAIPVLRSPRNAVNKQTVIAVGKTYDSAIKQFRLDHEGRVPIVGAHLPSPDGVSFIARAGANPDWSAPAARRGNGRRWALGPVRRGAGAEGTEFRAYITTGLPEPVSDGTVWFYPKSDTAHTDVVQSEIPKHVYGYVDYQRFTDGPNPIEVKWDTDYAKPAALVGFAPPEAGAGQTITKYRIDVYVRNRDGSFPEDPTCWYGNSPYTNSKGVVEEVATC